MIICFYLQNRQIQTSQTGGQGYSDTSPFNIPCFGSFCLLDSDREKQSCITLTPVVEQVQLPLQRLRQDLRRHVQPVRSHTGDSQEAGSGRVLCQRLRRELQAPLVPGTILINTITLGLQVV
jgi:hypothetical protein